MLIFVGKPPEYLSTECFVHCFADLSAYSTRLFPNKRFLHFRERISGTDWTMVITNDSKRYYYNTQTQVSLRIL